MTEEQDAPLVLRSEFTYPNGFLDLVKYVPSARDPYDGMEDALHEISRIGLDTLAARLVEAPTEAEIAAAGPRVETGPQKYLALRQEFVGKPELLALHGLVVACSRRRDPPDIATDLFLSMWRDHSEFLLDHLDTRWQISSLQTFRDFGETEIQRRSASELTIFFGLTKLYESERLFSGFRSRQPFGIEGRARGRLPMDMVLFSMRAGDLDRNLLGMLWEGAEADPVLRPLACRLLTELNRDSGSVFRRLRLMQRAFKRKMRAQRRAQKE